MHHDYCVITNDHVIVVYDECIESMMYLIQVRNLQGLQAPRGSSGATQLLTVPKPTDPARFLRPKGDWHSPLGPVGTHRKRFRPMPRVHELKRQQIEWEQKLITITIKTTTKSELTRHNQTLMRPIPQVWGHSVIRHRSLSAVPGHDWQSQALQQGSANQKMADRIKGKHNWIWKGRQFKSMRVWVNSLLMNVSINSCWSNQSRIDIVIEAGWVARLSRGIARLPSCVACLVCQVAWWSCQFAKQFGEVGRQNWGNNACRSMDFNETELANWAIGLLCIGNRGNLHTTSNCANWQFGNFNHSKRCNRVLEECACSRHLGSPLGTC